MMIRRYLSHCIFFSQIIVSTAFVHQPTLFYPSASKSQYQKSYHLLTNNSNSNSGAISNPLRFKPQSNPCILNASESDEDKLDSFKDDIASKFSYDRYDNMGVFSPIAEKLDGLTGDWALSYADLSPATPRTFAGVSFLLTNVCYAFAGISLISQGDFFYGALIEIAGIISFWYHFSQLEFGKERNEVRLALLTDYFTAGAALITGGVYMIQMGVTSGS